MCGEIRTIAVEAVDGFRLATRLHLARGTARAVTLIVPAVAVPQSCYAPLAAWLGECGFDVLTFDFRGMGESASASLRGFQAEILTWARQSCRRRTSPARSWDRRPAC
jgi:predicted alpha/beta hydrolase